jgi:phage tail protein X
MSRYDNYTFTQTPKLDVENKRRYYDSLIDPVIEKSVDDIYVVTSVGERLDLLAWKYYQDPELWWIISAANPELRKDSLYLEPGIQVRVPRDYQVVLQLFIDQNSFR